MKTTSEKAFQRKEKFAGTHRQRILNVLTKPLTGNEIAIETNLTQHQVMKRMCELERTFMVFVAGEKNGEGIYYKADAQTKITHRIKQFENREAKYLKALEGINKNFPDLISVDLKICIDIELS